MGLIDIAFRQGFLGLFELGLEVRMAFKPRPDFNEHWHTFLIAKLWKANTFANHGHEVFHDLIAVGRFAINLPDTLNGLRLSLLDGFSVTPDDGLGLGRVVFPESDSLRSLSFLL